MKELEEENETMRKKKNENEKSHRSIQEQLANQVCALQLFFQAFYCAHSCLITYGFILRYPKTQ